MPATPCWRKKSNCGAISSAFLNETTKRVLIELATHSPNAIVMLMLFDGETAALRLGFEYLGTYFGYLSAYSDKFSRFSPGKLLFDFCYMTERERGTRIIDLLPPDGEHKRAWSNNQIGVADHALALTVKGALFAFTQQKVGSALRWTWSRLPTGLRSFLATKILKL